MKSDFTLDLQRRHRSSVGYLISLLKSFKRMRPIPIFLLFILTLATASATTAQRNATASSPQASKLLPKTARGEFHHHHGGGGYDHFYPPIHHGHFKEFDHYLLPVLIVLGLGVLVMPLLSVLMTTMVGNVPVTTLVSGRKRRSADDPQWGVVELLAKVEKAIEAFAKLQ